jgi:DeoR family transcriptional regulator, aga operon transcriptional repressor
VRRTDRLAAILAALDADGSIDVVELADRLSVSAATLRRDLALLEEERLLARTHGGAVTTGVAYPLHNRLRDERRDLKRALARVAASRVPIGPQVVALTGGVVTPGVARELADRDRLTVVTNALDIAADLAMRPRLKVVVTGGVTRPKSYSLAGPWAEHLLRDVTIGTAFVEVDALTADGGLMTDDEVEARTVRALVERAARTIVLADGSRLGRIMLAHIVPVTDVDEVLTDPTAHPAQVEALRDAGATVTVVADGDPEEPPAGS